MSESSTETHCKRCGFPTVIDLNSLCGECDWFQRKEEAIRQRESAENWKRRAEMLEILGEGALERFTFDKFQPVDAVAKKALEVCRAFEPAKDNLYLFGITGTGKTHLACAITIKAHDSGKTFRFFPSGPSLSRWTRGLDGPEEDRRIDELARVDLLVINELGIGRDTEYSIGTAIEVIDRRNMRGKNGMIVTSNLHPADLAMKMNDARLESRFTGLCKIIEAGKMDYRKKFRKA